MPRAVSPSPRLLFISIIGKNKQLLYAAPQSISRGAIYYLVHHRVCSSQAVANGSQQLSVWTLSLYRPSVARHILSLRRS